MGRMALPAAALLIVTGALLAAILLFRHGFAPSPGRGPSGLVLVPAGDVAALPGWRTDDPVPALAAFARGCAALVRAPDARPMGRNGVAGHVADWRGVCAEAATVAAEPAAARAFFERGFVPFLVRDGDAAEGLFTGYYEPELRGSLVRGARYPVPLLGRPDDLVDVDLGAFQPELRGRRIAGRVVAGRLVPYPPRADIVAGGLGARARPILWVDDPVAAFFLEIQGSGRVVLDDGRVVRVGYAARNGQPYTAIGRVLIARGALTRETVSLRTIRDWLRAHPDQAPAVMNANRSYIFFRVLDPGDPGLGPPGSQGVALTPGRSLAVDPAFHALGVPIWLDVAAPAVAADQAGATPHLRRLMVAQDTGGAITGPVRGDVFWGFGPAAEALAGPMKSRGRMAVLLPRAVAARFAGRSRVSVP